MHPWKRFLRGVSGGRETLDLEYGTRNEIVDDVADGDHFRNLGLIILRNNRRAFRLILSGVLFRRDKNRGEAFSKKLCQAERSSSGSSPVPSTGCSGCDFPLERRLRP